MTVRSPVKWTPAARSRVIELYRDPSHSGSTIAAVILAEYGIAVSKSAVIGVAYRGSAAGVRPPRISSAERLLRNRDRKRAKRAAARAGIPAPPPAPRVAKPKAVRVPKAAPAPRPVPIVRPAAPVCTEILPSLRIPLIDAPAGACRYIADDPKAGPATVCGRPAAHGSAWCPGHRRVCVVPVRPVWIPGLRRAA